MTCISSHLLSFKSSFSSEREKWIITVTNLTIQAFFQKNKLNYSSVLIAFKAVNTLTPLQLILCWETELQQYKSGYKNSTTTDRDGQTLPTALNAAPLYQGHFPEGNRSCWHNAEFTVRPCQSGNERSACRWATVLFLLASCLLIPTQQNTKIEPHERVLYTEYGEEELTTPILTDSGKSC